MRWTLRIAAILLAAWIGYALSPLVALYRLDQAVQSGDTEAVRRRLNVRALRLSLLRQVVDAALETQGAREMEAGRRQVATEAAMTFAEPVVAALLTPEAVLDLLRQGWPVGVAPERPPQAAGFRIASLARLAAVVFEADWRGFRTYSLPYPPGRPPERQYRLRLRLAGATWRLVALDLPPELRARLVQAFAEASRR